MKLALKLITLISLIIVSGLAISSTPWSTDVTDETLRMVMPTADQFSEKSGAPPVYKAFKSNAETGEPELIGYIFLSADVPPEEKGYSAPIDMLIGLNIDGTLSGLKILNYIDSYRYSRGDFLATEGFQEQFQQKNIRDEFRLHHDVDGVSNATISSWAITRGVRNAARRVAEVYLDYQPDISEVDIWNANAASHLAQFTWEDLIEQGLVVKKDIPMPLDAIMELSIIYIGQPAIGELFIGEEDYGVASRLASIRFDSSEMILFLVGGDTSQPFQQQRFSFQQGDNSARRIHPRRIVSAGSADQGMIANKGAFAGAFVMDSNFDPTQPFTFFYQPLGTPEPIAFEYQLTGVALSLAKGEPVLSIEEAERQRILTSPWYIQAAHGILWEDTDWVEFSLLSALIILVTVAFFKKHAPLRWIGLTATLLYLGFYNGGFLSVSHIASLVAQGPISIVSSAPLLLIFLFTLITTLLWGRLFCASLCPFGALQDFISRFVPKRWRITVPQAIHQPAFWVKYIFLGIIIVVAFSNNTVSIFQYFEPFGTLFYFSTSIFLWAILLLIIAGSILVDRFYCRYLCPLGAALAIVSLVSPWRIKRVSQCNICKVCEQACPTGAIEGPNINFKECVRCDVCEIKLIEKAGTCRHSVGDVKTRLKQTGVELISSSKS